MKHILFFLLSTVAVFAQAERHNPCTQFDGLFGTQIVPLMIDSAKFVSDIQTAGYKLISMFPKDHRYSYKRKSEDGKTDTTYHITVTGTKLSRIGQLINGDYDEVNLELQKLQLFLEGKYGKAEVFRDGNSAMYTWRYTCSDKGKIAIIVTSGSSRTSPQNSLVSYSVEMEGSK